MSKDFLKSEDTDYIFKKVESIKEINDDIFVNNKGIKTELDDENKSNINFY